MHRIPNAMTYRVREALQVIRAEPPISFVEIMPGSIFNRRRPPVHEYAVSRTTNRHAGTDLDHGADVI